MSWRSLGSGHLQEGIRRAPQRWSCQTRLAGQGLQEDVPSGRAQGAGRGVKGAAPTLRVPLWGMAVLRD